MWVASNGVPRNLVQQPARQLEESVDIGQRLTDRYFVWERQAPRQSSMPDQARVGHWQEHNSCSWERSLRAMPGDYHNAYEMNSTHFKNWQKNQLLSNLPAGAVIVVDNALYHNRRTPESVYHSLNVQQQKTRYDRMADHLRALSMMRLC